MSEISFQSLLSTEATLLHRTDYISYNSLSDANKKRVCVTAALELIRAEALCATPDAKFNLAQNLSKLDEYAIEIMKALG